MTLTNKALRLKRFRELKEIFKNNKDIVSISYYKNKDNEPFGHVIYIKNGLEYEYIKKLVNKGFGIANILKKSARINNSEPIDIIEIQVWKQPVEKNEYHFLFGDEGSNYHSFHEWEHTQYAKKSKEIGSEEYYRVKYEIALDEKSEYQDNYWVEKTKVSQLEAEIKQLKEDNYK